MIAHVIPLVVYALVNGAAMTLACFTCEALARSLGVPEKVSAERWAAIEDLIFYFAVCVWWITSVARPLRLY